MNLVFTLLLFISINANATPVIEAYCWGDMTPDHKVKIEPVLVGAVTLHYLTKTYQWKDGTKTIETGVARYVEYPLAKRRYLYDNLVIYADVGAKPSCTINE